MIQYLLFDLDNTLYPESVGMENDIVRRMREFVAAYLHIPLQEATRLQKNRPATYGTTLEWLMSEYHLTDTEAYYRAIHPEGEEEVLSPHPGLAAMLDRIDLPRAILTNSPREHAARVARKLGIDRSIDTIFDIRFNGLKGKPHESAFMNVMAAIKMQAPDVLFIDDMPKYVRGFQRLGGNGLLVDEQGLHHDADMPKVASIMELEGYLAGQKKETLHGSTAATV